MKNHQLKPYPKFYYQVRKKGIWYHDTQNFCEVIWNLYKPTSVADIGCGPGVYLKCLSDLGVNDVFGVEGSDKALSEAVIPYIVKHDLRSPFRSSGVFNMVICIEVAEHIDREYADTLLQTIMSLCAPNAHLIFTAARPGQLGIHHVNLQPPSFWREKLRQHNFTYSEEETAMIRKSLKPIFMHWVKRNLMYFQFN